MLLAELSGLGAALCWTISGLMAPRLIQRFGTMRFNTVRILIASTVLLLICFITQRFSASLWQHADLIILSGLFGIFIGDTMLFTAVHRLGPRRTGVLYATNAPMSILLSWLFLNEHLSLNQLFACGLVLAGVVVAILFGKRNNLHAWEQTKGKLSVGIMIALVLAYGLFYRHKLPEGAIPFGQLTRLDFMGITALAIIGMVTGMSLLVWGIGNANVGIVTTLSAVVPVLILPGLWITTGQRPALGAWLGAILVVIGATLIILN